jgi:hypothetical protein
MFGLGDGSVAETVPDAPEFLGNRFNICTIFKTKHALRESVSTNVDCK